MRDPLVALYVASALVLAWGLRAAWRSRHDGGLLAAALQVGTFALAAVLAPIVAWYAPAKTARWAFVAVALAGLVVWRLVPVSRWTRLQRAIAARPRLETLLLVVWSTLLAAGGLEVAASSAVRARLVQRYTPTETVLAQQTEDWRLSHVMSDDYREPDPELLWRPVARAPYTSQRFRGPEVSPAKPAATLRVLCLGDSNTDGPLEGGAWPEALSDLLSARTSRQVEVLNGGVTGYSSFQGAARAAREVPRFRPDVVLVAFGWNDASNAIGGDDKAFAATARFRDVSPWRVALRRAAFRYDAVLVAARFATRGAATAVAAAPFAEPRVSVDDYAANLRSMVRTAQANGARVALLTRPHREGEAVLAASDGWRRRVPAYTMQTRAVADELRVPLIDAEAHFDGHTAAFADESHLTRAGHAELAALVRDTLRRDGVLP